MNEEPAQKDIEKFAKQVIGELFSYDIDGQIHFLAIIIQSVIKDRDEKIEQAIMKIDVYKTNLSFLTNMLDDLTKEVSTQKAALSAPARDYRNENLKP